MVPGSTLMYGSSLRTETARPRALRRRPTLAAVMPFPSEDVTPPVTKTYFAMWLTLLRGFFQFYGRRRFLANRTWRGASVDRPRPTEPAPRPVAAGRSGRGPRARDRR